jgi:hypothetical protein
MDIDSIDPQKPANHYFDNTLVENMVREYVLDGAINIDLRNKIMAHAIELIENVIRVNNFINIMNNPDQTSIDELKSIAWQAIEMSLYKFNATNEYKLKNNRKIKGQCIEELEDRIFVECHDKQIYEIKKCLIKSVKRFHTKIFAFWSQVAKTCILAHIKKDKRDKRNKKHYTEHLLIRNKTIRKYDIKISEFIDEAKKIFMDSTSHKILDSLFQIYITYMEIPKSIEKEICQISKLNPKLVKQFFNNLRKHEDLFHKFLNNIELNKIDYSEPLKDTD